MKHVPLWVWFLVGGVGSAGLYVGLGALIGVSGYPLDDAWIHQTYARNLALRGEWAFVPGQVSGGSTAPLWTVLLAPGHWLPGESYRLWTFLLGGLSLGLLAWLSAEFVRRALPDHPWAAWAAGGLVLAEWHLVWAGASGMETVLFSAVLMAALVLMWAEPGGVGPVAAGGLVGLAMWVRPDGLTLLPFVLAGQYLIHRQWRLLIVAGLAFGVLAAGYLGFNLVTAGEIWPTTFYAKQAEYAALRDLPLWTRAFQVGLAPLVGVVVLLAPGWVLAAVRKKWVWLLPLAWAGAYLGVFVLRLPATYQHGRYQMPVIAMLLVTGVLGVAAVVLPNAPSAAQRIMSRAWLLSTGALALAFFAIGANAFVTDTRFINEEMVAAARWLAENTQSDDLIAVHDIGAVGFFAQREIVDLAGLVSPEVIPFITDGVALQAHIEAQGADYLMTFPDWPGYDVMVNAPGWEIVFEAEGALIRETGKQHMTIYQWRR